MQVYFVYQKFFFISSDYDFDMAETETAAVMSTAAHNLMSSSSSSMPPVNSMGLGSSSGTAATLAKEQKPHLVQLRTDDIRFISDLLLENISNWNIFSRICFCCLSCKTDNTIKL